MITINLSDKQAAELKSMLSIFEKPNEQVIAKEVTTQINNQQFDVSDFESSRQYEALSVHSVEFIPKNEFTKGRGWLIRKLTPEYSYLENWDKATKK